MKRKISFILLIIFCVALIFAQNKNDKPATEGDCSTIVNSIREKHGNDSIAIDIFKFQYQIINLSYDDRSLLLKKNYIELIRYFNSEEGKECFCRSNIIIINREELLKRHVLFLGIGEN